MTPRRGTSFNNANLTNRIIAVIEPLRKMADHGHPRKPYREPKITTLSYTQPKL